MTLLTFSKALVQRLIDHTRAAPQQSSSFMGPITEPSLFIVKDEGCYLMSAGSPGLLLTEAPDAKHFVVYAKGLDPTVEDRGVVYDRCREQLGGDDFGEIIPASFFDAALADPLATVTVEFTADKIGVHAADTTQKETDMATKSKTKKAAKPAKPAAAKATKLTAKKPAAAEEKKLTGGVPATGNRPAKKPAEAKAPKAPKPATAPKALRSLTAQEQEIINDMLKGLSFGGAMKKYGLPRDKLANAMRAHQAAVAEKQPMTDARAAEMLKAIKADKLSREVASLTYGVSMSTVSRYQAEAK